VHLTYTDEQEELRRELADYFGQLMTPEVEEEMASGDGEMGRGDVYRRLVHNVGDWWSSAHTFSGDSHALTIDNRAPGCFCERLPNLGTARHMEVVMAAPGEKLVMRGPMGPLQTLAITAVLSIQLSPDAGGAKLVATYAAGGYIPGGLNTWAATLDKVLTEQFTRLKNYVEHGTPLLPPGAPKP